MRMHVNFGVNESSMCDYIFKEKCAILQFKKYIIYLVSSKVSTVILLLFVIRQSNMETLLLCISIFAILFRRKT